MVYAGPGTICLPYRLGLKWALCQCSDASAVQRMAIDPMLGPIPEVELLCQISNIAVSFKGDWHLEYLPILFPLAS